MAPLIDAARLADAVDAQRAMAAIDQLLRFAAAKDFDQVRTAVALATLRKARHTGQVLPSFERPILKRSWFAAVVAAVARGREDLAEVLQQHSTTTLCRLREAQHLPQLLPRHALLFDQWLS